MGRGRIGHLTSAHPRNDIRIFSKECKSLARAGYTTFLVVADGNGDELRDDVRIVDAGASNGRLDRMHNTTRRVFAKALMLEADVYHLHDPELIPIGMKLKSQGKKVIFDAHEDVPKQILGKHYLNPVSRRVISQMFSVYERWALCKFDGVISATPAIRDKFKVVNRNGCNVNNFPMLGELQSGEIDWSGKENKVCYVGGIAQIRGIKEVIRAMEIVGYDVRLQLVGKFGERSVEVECKGYSGWRAVDELGFLDREAVKDVLRDSIAGLVTFLPSPNHVDAQPNKMFEYMSAGVPVIASNFPLWREIVEGNQCGICVDPLQPQAIADAIDYLATHPAEAEQMGRNGQAAVQERYNWRIEEGKLLRFYQKILLS